MRACSYGSSSSKPRPVLGLAEALGVLVVSRAVAGQQEARVAPEAGVPSDSPALSAADGQADTHWQRIPADLTETEAVILFETTDDVLSSRASRLSGKPYNCSQIFSSVVIFSEEKPLDTISPPIFYIQQG
jgi:hypothetical protein